ncbi:DUF6250 domain-containing protein [Dyadobacter subterraneus]|uniref:DUF6250 domain-containing protein n=1 Tax=Dyadobacter subterraneus TaxID=2773304 RepID=UPI001D15F390|nr:DUF6250 domain-containing protein [Dyadobacter subterraneus]
MKSYLFCLLIIFISYLPNFAVAQIPGKDHKNLIFQDDFQKPLDTTIWKPEIADLTNSSIITKDGKLVIDTKGGVTVWLNKLLKTNIEITYNWTVLVGTGKNDRLSDLNQFWMASDPLRTNLFTRKGKLEEYDSLSLYYVGMGGNSNTTTRFRKYPGDGQRVLLLEYTDKDHLLIANKTYQIRIIVKNGVTEFWVDGNKYFFYQDKNPLITGYFGFRSTSSMHEISDFKVYQLED